MMNHWAADEIGRPWLAGVHDCWAFFRRVQAERYGRHVPPFQVDARSTLACARAMNANPERQAWHRVSTPEDGDAVILARGKHPTHVGIWLDIDGGGVLHCQRGAGVIFQDLRALGLAGWSHLEFYRKGPG